MEIVDRSLCAAARRAEFDGVLRIPRRWMQRGGRLDRESIRARSLGSPGTPSKVSGGFPAAPAAPGMAFPFFTANICAIHNEVHA